MNINEVKFALRNGLVNPKLTQSWLSEHKFQRNIAQDLEDCIGWRKASIALIFFITVVATVTIVTYLNRGNSTQVILAILAIVVWFLATTILSLLYRIIGNHRFVTSLSELQKLLATYAVDGKGTYLLNRDDEWLERNADDILQILANSLREHEAEDVYSDGSKRWRALFKNAHAIFLEFGLCERNQGKWLPKNPPRQVTVTTEVSAATA